MSRGTAGHPGRPCSEVPLVGSSRGATRSVPGAGPRGALRRAPRPRAHDPRSLGRTLDRVPEPLTHRPDVLVLGGGGTLGEAWMRGLLDGAGAATGIDFRDCEYFVGTSAGSIVAAFLAAGREPDSGAEARAARDWADAAEGNGARPGRFKGVARLGLAAATPLAPLALASATPG